MRQPRQDINFSEQNVTDLGSGNRWVTIGTTAPPASAQHHGAIADLTGSRREGSVHDALRARLNKRRRVNVH
jgi:hypothetical protein